MIAIRNISKTYEKGTIRAVTDVSFSVAPAELFGLIGPDGAGKTTLFRILTTLLRADSGTASVNGHDVVKDYKAIRSEVGYMPGKFSLYQDLTLEENLRFFATLFNTTIEANYDLIRDIYEQIKPFKNRRAGKLSGGMKQKLALCCALVHKPAVLFLDEPTTGVDVVSRREFWEMLKRLREQGIAILVSTPYMDEATLCDRIALIESGRILSVDTPQGVRDKFPDNLYAVRSDDRYRLLRELRKDPGTRSCYPFGEYLHLTLEDNERDYTEALLRQLNDSGHTGVKVLRTAPTIEDCFIRLMNAS